MAGFGLPEADIAVLIDVDVATLRQHFRPDRERGAAEGAAQGLPKRSSRWRRETRM